RVEARLHLEVESLHAGDVGGPGDLVVDQRGGDRLPVGVVDDLLEQRLGDALGEAALHLPARGERVDHGAAVVDGHVPQDADAAGVPVDLDDAGVRAAGVAEIGRLVVVHELQADL